jgi:hypothetical protein
LARCDDLTQGQWINQPWLMPEYGDTALQDLRVGPDGNAYLSYWHRSAASLEELAQIPLRHYIARLHEDLTTEVYPTGLEAEATRLVVDSQGKWFLVGRPKSGGNLHLWLLDSAHGFQATQEYELPGTDKLQGYVTHTLRPERFGGEGNSDTVHLLNCSYASDHAQLWHACFNLPSQE